MKESRPIIVVASRRAIAAIVTTTTAATATMKVVAASFLVGNGFCACYIPRTAVLPSNYRTTTTALPDITPLGGTDPRRFLKVLGL